MVTAWRRRTAIAILVAWAGGLSPSLARASYEAERELGRHFALQARAQLPLITDVDVVGYVSAIGKRLVAALDGNPFDYEFFVVRDPRINAFAVPGGYIYVHSGLLSRAASDQEVAGVLAHEVAHIHAHHLARQQEATQLMNYAALLGLMLSVVQPAIGAGALAANAATQLQYRREFEQEADYLGSHYMREAGYDPKGMLDFFKKLADEQRLAPASVPPYLLSHPLTDTRLTNLEAVLRSPQWATDRSQPMAPALARIQVLARAHTEGPGDVVTAYRQLVEKHPDDAQSRYLLGVVFLETGAFESARLTLDQARTMGWPAADRELGRTLLRLRRAAEARRLLAGAVETDPSDATAFAELGKALESLGDSDGAIAAYERALALAPSLEPAHYDLAILAGRAGREAEGFFHLAEAQYLRGEYDKALRQYENAEPLLAKGSERQAHVEARVKELREFLGTGKFRR